MENVLKNKNLEGHMFFNEERMDLTRPEMNAN